MKKLNSKKLFITGALTGNVMEFFDFIIYAYLAKYIAINFFPHENQFVSKLLMFSVFASGYITRPFGAIIFGYIGDRFGRKIALIQSIVVITLATVCIGVLPTYAEIGLLSPILLVICRLTQGFAVSGEQSGVAVYLSESVGSDKNGFIGSLVLGSSYTGVLLGSLICLLVSSCLTEQTMRNFGWRIPFLLSIILGVGSLIFRIKGTESLEFKKARIENKLSSSPVGDTFKQQWRDMILLVMSLAVPIYMYTIYLPNYIVDIIGVGFKKSLMLSTVSLCFISILVPAIGKFSDDIGKEKVLLIGLIASSVLGYPIFLLLSYGQPFSIVFGQFFLGCVVSLIAAPMLGVLLNVFPIHLRYTGVSFVFNTGMAIFGSTVPVIAISLIEFFGNKTCPGLYLSLSGIIGTLVLYIVCYKNFNLNALTFGIMKQCNQPQ